MEKTISKKTVVLLTLVVFLSVLSIAFAAEKDAGVVKFEQNTAGIKVENATAPAPGWLTEETSLIIAGNYDVDGSTITIASSNKGGDGAACSDNDECSSGVCEGGSCCTDYGASCDSSSHCCGHQSCTNGTCPQ